MHCDNCKYEKLNEPHFYNENICECSLFNNVVNQVTTITFIDAISTRAYPTIVGTEYTLPEGRDSEPDEIGRVKKFTGWTDGDKTYLPGEKVTVNEDMRFNYVYEYQYLIKIADDMTNGKLTADYEMAPEGTTITVTPQPQPGYRLKNIWYIRKDHGTGYLDHVEGSESYTVTLPPSQITLHAEFEQITYENHTHEDETVFSPCTDPGVLSGSGNYYLIGDTELTASSLASGTLNICLMGHKLTITDDNFTIAQGATLSVYDETGKGIVTGKTIRAEGTFNLYNGNLKGFTSGAVSVGSGGVFNVYGGGIIDNTSSAHGAGVSVASGGSLNIHGDVTIHMNSRIDSQSNTADDNVYLEQGAVVNIVGELSEESVIGVTVADTEHLPCTVTSVLNGKAVARNFLSDDDAYFMEYSSADDTVKLSSPFVLSFDANGGTGEMPDDSVKDEKYFLPGCDFTPPAGKAFCGWRINDRIYQPGDPFIATSNQSATAYAVWENLYTVTVNETQNGTVTASAQIAKEGDVITLDVTPADRCAIGSVSADGTQLTPHDGVYSFTMPDHDVTVSADFIKIGYFAYHSISLQGDIGLNFYLELTEAEIAGGAEVDFSWTVNGIEKTHSVTLTAADKTDIGYKATVPVAVAEMTYDVSATLTLNGNEVDTDVYSVKRYADKILSDDFRDTFLEKHNEATYQNLIALVKAMLNYGAKAQINFERNTDYLADEDIDYKMPKVTAAMITTEASDMESGLDDYGLQYAGSTIVYLTKTSIRHYYTVNNPDDFRAVKDDITFNGEKVGYREKDGKIYFELKNVAAADLDTPYTLRIGNSSYNYCVLDYVRDCLNAPNAPYATKQLVSATYWYNQAANAYFGR